MIAIYRSQITLKPGSSRRLVVSALAAQSRREGENQDHEKDPVAGARVKGFRSGRRQNHIGIADRIEIHARNDPASRVDDAAYSIVRIADQRQAFFDRAGPGDREVLIWTGAVPVPGVI